MEVDPADLQKLGRGIAEAVKRQVVASNSWQPIETAPRGMDNKFLGWNGQYMDMTWEGWSDSDTCDPGEGRPVYVHADWVSWEPTHWMPLPTPPGA